MNYIKNKYTAFMIWVYFSLISSPAFSQENSGTTRLKNLLETKYFTHGLTWTLGIIAIIQWYDYFSNFTPADAVMKAIKPASMTFLAFNWITFAKWVQLIPG